MQQARVFNIVLVAMLTRQYLMSGGLRWTEHLKTDVFFSNNCRLVGLCRIQEEYVAKQKKLNMCFIDLEKAFDGDVGRVVVWAMRKKGILEALVRAVMSLYKGAKIKVGTCLSDEFEVNIGVHQGSVLLPLLFTIVVAVVKNEMKEGMLQEILYADDIVLIAETVVELQEKFYS